jgi:SAM-dependent methyltransferase
MNLIAQLHGGYVHSRRVRVLSDLLADLLPHEARVLDVGSGDGLLAHLTMRKRADLTVVGIDPLVREHTHIPVQGFDGKTIPYGDGRFDVVLFIDVLHHLPDPTGLLHEAVRVARQGLVIKDHTLQGLLARPTLRFMDWVSNAPHGVVLPYNYRTQEQWLRLFADLGLTVRVWKSSLRLYSWAADWLFGRSLHFLAQLDKPQELPKSLKTSEVGGRIFL